ncbi:hypothetical protein DMA11_05320 [Marinilabiliaceae bacterium JC017]|nr:hypothetical protein DMA11_05320 [Marinilabiliaceae bacterium JC017]
MKASIKRYLIVAALLLTSLSIVKSEEAKFKLTVNSKELKTGVIKLTDIAMMGPGKTITEGELVDGKCVLEGSVNDIQEAFVELWPTRDNLQKAGPMGMGVPRYFVFIENKAITLQTTSEDANGYVVIGSQSTSDLMTFRKELGFEAKMDQARKQANGNQELFAKSMKEIHKDYQVQLKELVKKNPQSTAACYLAYSYFRKQRKKDYTYWEELLGYFNNNIHAVRYYKEMNNEVATASFMKVGNQAPAFILKDVNGLTVSLKDFRGKIVLVDFWATWCAPCCKEIPYVAELYNKYKGENFEVVAISLDRNIAKWKAFIEKNKLTWVNLLGEENGKHVVADDYNVKGVPYNVLIDAQGNIIALNLHEEKLAARLEELFGKNKN